MILRKARSFLRRSPFERGLLLKAWILLAMVRLGLLLIPFRAMHRLVSRVKTGKAVPEKPGERLSVQVALAVQGASRYLPGKTTCLPQALVAALMLKRLGSTAHLRIGVARGEGGEFQAHAWVEDQGQVVIGMLQDLSRFTPFPPIPE